ncbi:MAG: Uncharacterized protein G01um10142_236 [Parcubacteria group bacterium Gr01-1014_2]|nr:MAG: Uncharacterized protein G01um10142_236 [Parcubacteria group bacterium Gr01-1014_2]
MPWCFAKVNNRLAEVYFDETSKGPKIRNHCYVKIEEYKTKKEQKWIKEDTARFIFVYRKGKYRRVKK